MQITFAERQPTLALAQVTYTNRSDCADQAAQVGQPRLHAHARRQIAPAFWSYEGASYEDRRDWVQPLEPGFEQRNYMGMNASDYGGGTPVVDIWRRDGGLAVGHRGAHAEARRVAGCRHERGRAAAHRAGETGRARAADRACRRCRRFSAVHRGDYFGTLVAYRALLAERGLTAPRIPDTSYEPIWCAWGYERNFTVEQIVATLPKVRELGLKWAVVDDGWQTAEGDWKLDPKKFPRGDADMIALVKEIKRAGTAAEAVGRAARGRSRHRPAARPSGAAAARTRTARFRTSRGGTASISCPAAPGTVENAKALVRRILGTWGYEGLKIDGQHLNGVAPCYNPAHHHRSPEESVEQLQTFWKTSTRPRARSIRMR